MTLPRPFRRIARHRLAISVVVTVLLLASVASTAGAYIYERSSADLTLPGVRIGDIEVGDFTRSEAVAAVTAAGVLLDQTLTIHVDGEAWVKSLSQLGVRARVHRAVDQAFALSGSLSPGCLAPITRSPKTPSSGPSSSSTDTGAGPCARS
jgi:hypothetical protein